MLFPRVESGLLAGTLPYVRFGEGEERLVIFPGIGDALQAVTDSPRSQAWFFRRFGRTFTIYLIGRKRNLPTGYLTRDMAVDYAEALAAQVGPSHVLGLSMGALIAQHLAADFPTYVRGLILSLAGARGTPEALERGRTWQRLALEQRWPELSEDAVGAIFTGMHQMLWRFLLPRLVRWPEASSDFVVSTQACLDHVVWEKLGSIPSPTLVLGGAEDQLFPAVLLQELAEFIPQAQLHRLFVTKAKINSHPYCSQVQDNKSRKITKCGNKLTQKEKKSYPEPCFLTPVWHDL